VASRWIAVAEQVDDRWVAHAPRRLHTPGVLPALAADGRSAVFGVDAPMGVPRAYARRAGIRSFREWLLILGEGDWRQVYEVCETADEIALTRPFYPKQPGGTSRAHLTGALGCSWDELLRLCDRAHRARRAASPLFWTLGGQQVGKGALALWREVLQPALRDRAIGLWPFDGSFESLAASKELVVVETYPTEFHERLGIRFTSGGKRVQPARTAQAPALRGAADRLGVDLEPRLANAIASGFGRDDGVDDGFDAVVGLLGMLDVLARGRIEIPADPAVHAVEGWMFGMSAAATGSSGQVLGSVPLTRPEGTRAAGAAPSRPG
jgi:hypothetical protein